MPRDNGLFVIIVYKLLRAVVSLGAAAALSIVIATGHTEALVETADALRQHLTSHWSSALADRLVQAVTPRHVEMAAIALACDGALVLVEGWALWRGRSWGPWVVVASTSALLPFDVIGLWRRPRLGRILFLLGNLAVVLYLLRRVVVAGARGST